MAGFLDRLAIRHYREAPIANPPKARTPYAGTLHEGIVDLRADPLKLDADFQVKGAVLGLNDTLGQLLGLGDPNSITTIAQYFMAYDRSSAVSIPINLVAENFANVTPVVRNLKTDETDREHPMLDLLRKPHALFSRSLFLETLGKYYLITGEAPVVALGGRTKPPIALQPISPKGITMDHDMGTGLPSRVNVNGHSLTGIYTSRPIDQGAEFSNGSDRRLRIIRSFSTRDDSILRGQSKLTSAGRDIWQQLEGADYNLALMRQGGRASLVFQFKNTLNREVFKERRAEILSQVTGVENAGRVLVTHGGELDISEVSASNRDMEYTESQRSARLVLAQLYKVPLALMTTEASTFDNYEKSLLALWDDAVIPLSDAILGGLADWLLPAYGVNPSEFTLDFDRMDIDALRTRQIREVAMRKENGIETINEIRATVPGLEDLEGGDELLVPGTMSTLSAVAEPPEDDVLPPPGGGLPVPPTTPPQPNPEE